MIFSFTDLALMGQGTIVSTTPVVPVTLPSDVSAPLLYWLNADTLSETHSNGQTVTTWGPRSCSVPSTMIQPTATNKPTFLSGDFGVDSNGGVHAGVAFDGVDNFMYMATRSLIGPGTVFQTIATRFLVGIVCKTRVPETLGGVDTTSSYLMSDGFGANTMRIQYNTPQFPNSRRYNIVTQYPAAGQYQQSTEFSSSLSQSKIVWAVGTGDNLLWYENNAYPRGSWGSSYLGGIDNSGNFFTIAAGSAGNTYASCSIAQIVIYTGSWTKTAAEATMSLLFNNYFKVLYPTLWTL